MSNILDFRDLRPFRVSILDEVLAAEDAVGKFLVRGI